MAQGGSVGYSPLDERLIRQLYYVAYFQRSRFPSSLSTKHAHSKVGVTIDGFSALVDRPSSDETTAPIILRSDYSIPPCCSVYYFEVTLEAKCRSSSVAIGVCPSTSSSTEWLGMEPQTYGYHSNNGIIYYGARELTVSAPTFGEADVIGCGVNFVTNCLFFTKNGVFLGPVNAGKKLPHPLYPCVALTYPKCQVNVNFGHHKFAFDIGQYIARERAVVMGTAVDRKCTNQLAYVTMRNLVAAYLLHNGYLETADALGGWISKPISVSLMTNSDRVEKPTANETETGYHRTNGTFTDGSLETPVSDLSSPQDAPLYFQLHAVKPTEDTDNLVWPEERDLLLKRRQLCDAIRRGDYMSALTQLETHFQQLAEQDPSIGFVLRCHHFINLMCHKPVRHSSSIQQTNLTMNRSLHSSRTIHPPNNGEPHRGNAQKRPKPSNSLESSPEVVSNGYSYTKCCDAASGQHPLESDLSLHSSTRQIRSAHEHSPSSCQAPIRLRLSVPDYSGHSEATTDASSLPIYPANHHCYRGRSVSDNSIPCNLLNLDSAPFQVENGTLPGPDHPQDGRKRQHRITNSLLPVYGSADLEHGSEGSGTTVDLIDFLDFSPTNDTARFKCQNNSRSCTSRLSPIGSSPTRLGNFASQSTSSASSDVQSNGNAVETSNPPCYTSASGLLSNGVIPFDANGETSISSCSHFVNSHPSPRDHAALEVNGVVHQPHSDLSASTSPCNWSTTDDVLHLVEYGRLLRSAALELLQQKAITSSQIQLLVGAFGLIAYEDPYSSPFRQFLDPTHREHLADAVNSAILVHQNQPAKPVLDSALSFLQKALVDENTNPCSDRLTPPGIQFPDFYSNGLTDRYGRPDSSAAFTEVRSAVDSNIHAPRRYSDPANVYNLQHSSASPETPVLPPSHRTRIAVTEVQPLGIGTPSDDFNNGSSLPLHPTSTSPVSSIGVYIVPSALISFASRDISRNLSRVSTTSASLSIRPTTLTARSASRSARESHPVLQSPPASTPSTPMINTALSWPTSEPYSSARSHTRNPPLGTLRTAASVPETDSHVPSGPELAGFFHPILFIN